MDEISQRLKFSRIGLLVGALLAIWLLAANSPLAPTKPELAFLCMGLALVAELRPVHFVREGVLLCLSMPFLAGLLVRGGPVWALIGEVVVVGLATCVYAFEKSRKRVWYWATFNLPITILSVVFGGLAFLGGERWHSLWGVALFVPVYLITNFLLICGMNSQSGAKNFAEEVRHSVRGVAIGFVVYLLVALAVAALVLDRQSYLLPVLLLPILVLRAIVHQHREMEDLSYETMVALTIMLQRAHPYTHGHLERVGRIAEEVGRKLGIPRRRARLLREAAVLHDIGKIAIDEAVLDKPAKLTDEEYAHVKEHSEFGARILQDSLRFQRIVGWIRHHHERPDGNGYPHRLTDVEIPLESKIIAVADAYDAMVGGPSSSEMRNYREPMSKSAAIAELERCAGTQFDRNVVEAYKAVVGSEIA